MKYVLSLITGLLGGALVGGLLILFNPLTLSESEPLDSPEWALNYSLSEGQAWLLSHDNRVGLPVVPREVPLLWENGIKRGMIMAMPLGGEPGTPSAVGTRISFPSPETEFIRSGLVVEDHWLISVPDAGTFFVHATSNQWPLLRDTVVRVDWLKRDWNGPSEYDATRGPTNTGADVFGLTGSFQGMRGRGHERLSLESYAGSLKPLTGQLTIKVTNNGG